MSLFDEIQKRPEFQNDMDRDQRKAALSMALDEDFKSHPKYKEVDQQQWAKYRDEYVNDFTDPGFLSNMADLALSGVDTAQRGMHQVDDVITGKWDEDTPKYMAEEANATKPHPKELREAQENLQKTGEGWEDADGFLESASVIGNMLYGVAKEAVTNPKGLAYFTAEQAANMAGPLVGMYAGAKLGLLGGPYAPATVPAGALAGAFAGGWVTEAGLEATGYAIAELDRLGLKPTEENFSKILQGETGKRILSHTRKKATGTASIDAVFTMFGGRLATGPGRAAVKQATKELGAGATKEAVGAAAANILAKTPIAKKAGSAILGGVVDTLGEGLSEGGGTGLATGELDMGGIANEMFGSAGGSVAEVGLAANVLGKKAIKPILQQVGKTQNETPLDPKTLDAIEIALYEGKITPEEVRTRGQELGIPAAQIEGVLSAFTPESALDSIKQAVRGGENANNILDSVPDNLKGHAEGVVSQAQQDKEADALANISNAGSIDELTSAAMSSVQTPNAPVNDWQRKTNALVLHEDRRRGQAFNNMKQERKVNLESLRNNIPKKVTAINSVLIGQEGRTPAQEKAEKAAEYNELFAEKEDITPKVFQTEKGALLALKSKQKQGIVNEDYEVVPVEGGFKISAASDISAGKLASTQIKTNEQVVKPQEQTKQGEQDDSIQQIRNQANDEKRTIEPATVTENADTPIEEVGQSAPERKADNPNNEAERATDGSGKTVVESDKVNPPGIPKEAIYNGLVIGEHQYITHSENGKPVVHWSDSAPIEKGEQGVKANKQSSEKTVTKKAETDRKESSQTVTEDTEKVVAKPKDDTKPTPQGGDQASEVKSVHDYSNTQIAVKGAAAKKLVELGSKIPDSELYVDPKDSSYGRETEPHVTVRYGLATDNPADIQGLSALAPFSATMGKVSIFSNDDYDVVKVEIEGKELRAANKKVGDLVDVPGETFTDYQPHATIAYVKKGEGEKYVGNSALEGQKIDISEIQLTDRNNKTHTVKLNGKPKTPPKQQPRKVPPKKSKSGETTVADELQTDDGVKSGGVKFSKGKDELTSSSVIPDRDFVLFHSSVDPFWGDIESIRNITNSETFLSKGLKGLNWDKRRVVQLSVSNLIKDKKVFGAVIKLYPVDMVDIFMAQKFSPKNLLHDKSVLEEVFAFNTDNPISGPDASSSVFVSVVTSLATIRASARDWSGERIAARLTDEVNGIAPTGRGAIKLSGFGFLDLLNSALNNLSAGVTSLDDLHGITSDNVVDGQEGSVGAGPSASRIIPKNQLASKQNTQPKPALLPQTDKPSFAKANITQELRKSIGRFNLERMLRDGALKIVDSVEADKILSGHVPSIKSVSFEVAAFREANNLPEIKMRNDGSHPTQIATTKATYRKIYDKLMPKRIKEGRILDYGAGKNIGGKELGAETFEPFPEKGFSPTYSDTSSIPSSSFDGVISNAVINVVPDDIRADIVREIGRVLAPSGRAFINARGKDVFSAKHYVIDKKNMEVIVSGTGAYQKGFTQKELISYLSSTLGEGFVVVKPDVSFGTVCAEVIKDDVVVFDGSVEDKRKFARKRKSRLNVEWAMDVFGQNEKAMAEAKDAVEAIKEFAKSDALENGTPFKAVRRLFENAGLIISKKGSGNSYGSPGDHEITIASGSFDAIYHEAAHNLIENKKGTHSWSKVLSGEWSALYDAGFMGQSMVGDPGYMTRQTERYANLFDTYMQNNKRLKKIAPGLYNKIESLLDEHIPLVALLRKTRVAAIGNSNYSSSAINDFLYPLFAAKGGVDVLYSKDGRVQGYTLPDGTVHLVQDNIAEGKANDILLHEMGVHARKLLQSDESYQKIEQSTEDRLNEDSATGRALRAADARIPDDTAPENRNAERLAYLIEDAPKVGIVSRLISRIKSLLIKVFGKPVIDRLTVGDLKAMAIRAVRSNPAKSNTFPSETKEGIPIHYVEKTELGRAFGSFEGDRILVRKDLPDAIKRFVVAHEEYHSTDMTSGHWITRELKASLFPGIKDPIGLVRTIFASLTPERLGLYTDQIIDRDNTPEINSFAQSAKMSVKAAGRKIANLAAFKEWFGDSTMTTDGKVGSEPQVFYHGTRRKFDTFESSNPIAAFGNGNGIYFTSDKRVAEEYAENDFTGEQDEYSRVIPVYLKIESHKDGMSKVNAYGGDTEVIIHKPENIKAINNTSWNPKNPNILKSVASTASDERNPPPIGAEVPNPLNRYTDLIKTLKDDKKDIYAKQAALSKHIKKSLPKVEQWRVIHHIKNIAKPTTAAARQKMLDTAIQAVEKAHHHQRQVIKDILSEKDIIARRRESIKSIRDFLGLEDSDLRKISRKDIRLMNNREFSKFKEDIMNKAIDFADHKQAKAELMHIISTRRLKKVENLQKAMELPTINKMSKVQLEEFAAILSLYEVDDTFMGKRALETVDRADFLKGIKTWREAKDKLAEKTGVSVEDLSKIKVAGLDHFRWDSALVDQNPFYELLVQGTTSKMLGAQMSYQEIEDKAYALAAKSEKSRKRKIVDRIIPQDEQIFSYIEAKESDKFALADKMTSEQLDYAHFIQEYFGKALEYLIEIKTLDKGRENYFVHMRRTFLENWRDNGLLSAVNNIFKNYEDDQHVFNILDDDTGNILPMEKFFQFSLQRTGGLTPTKNVTRAFLSYAQTFEKKRALDALIPEMEIYSQSLTPEDYTETGLEIDSSLKKYVHKYINNKKGRRISYDSTIRQGGGIDLVMNGLRTFTTLLDLGLNIPVGIASFVGEQTTNFAMLGINNYTKGSARMKTNKGKLILQKYRAFTGRSAWEEFTDPGKEITERLGIALFGLFHQSSVFANKQFLLGNLSKIEYNTGILSDERLAELQLEMGRFRVVPGTSSLVGSTSTGKMLKQYKGWAVPVLRTTTKDIKTLASDLKNKPTGEALTTKEAKEIYRIISITSIALLVGMLAAESDDDDLLGQIRSKAYRESTTLMQGMDPKLWLSIPRVATFLKELGSNLSSIVKLEEYKTKPGLKGVSKLINQVTPSPVKKLIREED